jgi:aminoglycoside phosphotransferase family enzyme/predicted kinase
MRPPDRTALERHDRLVEALCRTLRRPGEPPPLRLETHLSSVIVAGGHAWKLKKPVSLGFVDFATRARRLACCLDEVRLNRRLAPALYLGVVEVTGSAQAPAFGPALEADGAGEPAVWMRAFDQQALWANRVPAGQVDPDEARAFGLAIGEFHRDRAARCADSPHGSTAAVRTRVLENFDALCSLAHVLPATAAAALPALRERTEATLDAQAARIDARHRAGFVRECHGDLHLGNIVTIDGVAVAFDCLEFDESLRTVDVASEVAFAMMDLEHAGRRDLAFAFLDGWMQATGDTGAVPLLDLFRTYRALVRAKVSAIAADQQQRLHPGESGRAGRAADAAASYLALAGVFSPPPDAPAAGPPWLVVTHGLSGSGKSVLAGVLAAQAGAVRLRSDSERKRLAGRDPVDRSGAHGAMYRPEARDAVYDRLAEQARDVLQARRDVIVDASFLARRQRERFAALAREAGARFAILDLQAPAAVLRQRLAARAARGDDPSDADLAVLELQLRTREPLDETERSRALVHRHDDPLEPPAVLAAWRRFAATDPARAARSPPTGPAAGPHAPEGPS